MEPEEDIEIINNFIMRNQLMETVEEVKQLEHLLKGAKERLQLEMEKRGLWGWKRWFWSILGYY
tara:strand:- start:1302 stop:1493 length:192 start_codon:yes stop_codon:yes gene_type:complete